MAKIVQDGLSGNYYVEGNEYLGGHSTRKEAREAHKYRVGQLKKAKEHDTVQSQKEDRRLAAYARKRKENKK